MPSVGIAGAGLAGRLLAHALVGAGWRVSLFDPDTRAGRASAGLVAAGMLAPYAELDTAEPLVFGLGPRSLALWPHWSEGLEAPVFFQRQGTLLVAHRQDMAEMERFTARLRTRLGERARLRPMDRAAVARLEPELAGRFGRAVLLPDEGQIDPGELFPALERRLLAAGVQWHEGTAVTSLSPGHLHTADGAHRFDWVVDARGLGAREALPALRGVRGEIITVHAPEVGLGRLVRLMHPRYPLYVAPRRDRHYVIGATTVESEDRSPISVRSTLELLSAAYSLHSGFAEARVTATCTQLRPALPDNLPRLWCRPGLLRINGLYRHGYLMGPALVEAALGLMENGTGGLRFPALLGETSDADHQAQ